MTAPALDRPAVAFRPAGGLPLIGASEDSQRWVKGRVALALGLLVMNVVTFYPKTWSGEPLLIPIPSTAGKLLTQGALPVALLLALSVNRRMVIRPSVFLCLVSLFFIEALMTCLQAQFMFGAVFRTGRLGLFVATLWLLTPWWGRRDLLLIRCYLAATSVVIGTVLLGLVLSPGTALAQGRLAGALWPIPPPQVAHFAAVTAGLFAVLWSCGYVRGRIAGVAVVVAGGTLLLTHTRTALIAMLAGLLVAGLSLFVARARVRKLFATASVVVSVGAITLSGVITTWLTRGESSSQLGELTGRTNVWNQVMAIPRNKFEVFFGFGLSNKSFQGLPIDSNWLATYFDQGLFGCLVCVSLLIFLFIAASFVPRGAPRAIALFLATYALVASLTETGFSDASSYLLELTLAAAMVAAAGAGRLRARTAV